MLADSRVDQLGNSMPQASMGNGESQQTDPSRDLGICCPNVLWGQAGILAQHDASRPVSGGIRPGDARRSRSSTL
jgi:hypothetical protein